MVWEAIFLLLILKIPIVYLASVVWYAIRAEQAPPYDPALTTAALGLDPGPGWRPHPARPRRGPHGGPRRTYPRRTAYAQAQVRK